MKRGLGQLSPDLATLTQNLPADLQPHIILRTPMGNAVVDPLAVSQDQRTQDIMNALGITMEVRFGPVPADVLQGPSLGTNLGLVAILAVLGILWWRQRRYS
jgi:hypothetical protein